ncbi:MAG: S-methyl-5-thioribose-1-phosphate isomerase, partial [Syntrophales bacterium]|nr:S-methyl-5-thioribose-1-phosphate isomerase [Syntrophales bacterium]
MIPYCSICWDIDKVKLLDQRLLPRDEIYLEITDYHEVIEAIRTLAIRGAPAIGVAAAMGAALGALALKTEDPKEFAIQFTYLCREIAAARPTAVNLFWALDRMQALAQAHAAEPVGKLKELLVAEAQTMLKEDEAINRRMAQAGQVVIHEGSRVLTHCNTGAL